MTSLRTQMRYLNPYDLHKLLINQYVLQKPGDTSIVKRDASKDKRDVDVIRENHKFLWDEEDKADTWELQFAKKYYDKLFKEYCIGDLSLYKENKIALRWRTEQEVVTGKGQFTCGNKRCGEDENLRTWEVNFGYKEQNEKKNALVKIRLCPDCSKKLNFHSKKREVKRLKRRTSGKDYKPRKEKEGTLESPGEASTSNTQSSVNNDEDVESSKVGKRTEETPWEDHKPEEVKSREEEMEEYLEDLLL